MFEKSLIPFSRFDPKMAPARIAVTIFKPLFEEFLRCDCPDSPHEEAEKIYFGQGSKYLDEK